MDLMILWTHSDSPDGFKFDNKLTEVLNGKGYQQLTVQKVGGG